ncbi:MAG: hypothetical protein O2903_01215 [Actinobacteria bacterium]|nr:hypothetical protein [Actinomycetota bacterium]MDA2981489.1 hypothetical protein [Actinomycetota bacterium]MDA2995968.1 hypothetical protein [Actinomycetota bacterium]
MRIDSHHHLWDLSIRDQEWITGEEMKPIRRNFLVSDLRDAIDDSRIDKTVLVQTKQQLNFLASKLRVGPSQFTVSVACMLEWQQLF